MILYDKSHKSGKLVSVPVRRNINVFYKTHFVTLCSYDINKKSQIQAFMAWYLINTTIYFQTYF